jgi:paraquat-inducible protein B
MSQLKNTKVVGGFVLGAIVLLVAAIVLFGGGALFQRTTRALIYFQGSVSGLSIGAPVQFRGVTVGSVADIDLEMNAETGAATIPVKLDLDPTRMPEAINAAERAGTSGGYIKQPITCQSLASISLTRSGKGRRTLPISTNRPPRRRLRRSGVECHVRDPVAGQRHRHQPRTGSLGELAQGSDRAPPRRPTRRPSARASTAPAEPK